MGGTGSQGWNVFATSRGIRRYECVFLSGHSKWHRLYKNRVNSKDEAPFGAPAAFQFSLLSKEKGNASLSEARP